ncbi:MAG: phosphoribosylanthranilate isomerase [Ignavibacteria bacterium]
MHPVKNIRFKVCCIGNVDEAVMAIELGASALGLVSKMPSGPGVISNEMICEIVKVIPPGVASFLLTSELKAEQIILQQKIFRTNTLQLVDEVEITEYEKIKSALPGVSIVQVIHVMDESSISHAVKISKHVSGILLDSGNPKLKIKELGGTGKVHDWEISRKIREAIDIPVFLAGGLNASNVTEAMDKVSPFCVDLCSGVRTEGNLDRIKLENFFKEVKSYLH